MGLSYKNVSEVAFEVGFNDPHNFTRVFKQYFGKVPSKINFKEEELQLDIQWDKNITKLNK